MRKVLTFLNQFLNVVFVPYFIFVTIHQFLIAVYLLFLCLFQVGAAYVETFFFYRNGVNIKNIQWREFCVGKQNGTSHCGQKSSFFAIFSCIPSIPRPPRFPSRSSASIARSFCSRRGILRFLARPKFGDWLRRSSNAGVKVPFLYVFMSL